MDPKPEKLEKYRAERERNTQRIAALHTRNEKLDKLIAELENLALHSLLRGANMSYRDLTDYIQSKAGRKDKKQVKQEDLAHEETAHGEAPAEEGLS